MAIKLTSDPAGVRMMLKVVPGSSRDRIVGVLGEALKVAVSKPPQDGAANRAVVKLLAEELGIPPASVSIIRGHGNPRKEVLFVGLDAKVISSRISDALGV